MKHAPRCEICAAPSRWWGVVDGYVFYCCRTCRHLFVHPRPEPSVLQDYYEAEAFYDKAQAEGQRLVREATDRARRLAALARREGLPLRLLDVGAATGIFLERAVIGGFEAEGVELSEPLARVARGKGLAVTTSTVETFRPAAPYAVVTAWELIEHVIDPCRVLARMVELTERGGLLALSTPRADGVPARLLGTRFPMVCPPEHLSLFSRASLTQLAGRLGLELRAFRSFSNLAHDNLRRGFTRYVYGRLPLSEPTVDRLATASAYLTAPLPALIDRAGYGSEMEVVFRRTR